MDFIREDFSVINTEDGQKRVSELCGWLPDLARESFHLVGSQIPKLRIVGASGPRPKRSMLFELGRKILGEDTENYHQLIEDCTSFLGKNCAEYLQFYPISQGDRNVFTKIFPPYIYGCERVFIGGQEGSYRGGGVGAWVSSAVQKYGVIATATPNCPEYSADIARDWGAKGPPEEFIQYGTQHIIKSTAAVTTLDDVKDALANFYPVGVCSSVGFDMLPCSDGFNHYSTIWNHAMTLIGYDEGDDIHEIPPCFCLLNSWADVHGTIIDFRTREKWPIGTLRISEDDVRKIIAENDSFTFSSLEGFPAQSLLRDDFIFI